MDDSVDGSGDTISLGYTYCLPLSRFRSYAVISMGSDEYRVVVRPWPGGNKRRGGGGAPPPAWGGGWGVAPPRRAPRVSRSALEGLRAATPPGEPWASAVTLPPQGH